MTWKNEERLQQFLQRWPERAALVPDVVFRRKETSQRVQRRRRVLVISTAGLRWRKKAQMQSAVLDLLEQGTVSFPAWEKATHLFLRLGRWVYDNGFFVLPGIFHWGDIPIWRYRFKRTRYPLPRSRRLETVLRLNEDEIARLQTYIANILQDRKKVLGEYDHGGSQKTRASVTDNQSLDKGHNCTSWLSTAPVGPRGEALLEILGGHRDEEIGTNPGWWYTFLLSQTDEDRVPLVIYWTSSSLEKALREEVRRDEMISWDYLRR